MTRRLVPLIAGVLLLLGAAIGAPAPAAEAAAFEPSASSATAHESPLALRVGDGIFQLRIQLCERCGARLTIEISFSHFTLTTPLPRTGSRAVNHLQPAA